MTPEERFIDFFTRLTPQTLKQIDTIFAVDAHFKDPFNDVTGLQAIRTIFTHMFATTETARFQIINFASRDQHLFIQWGFSFEKNKKSWQIDGCSMVTFNNKGEVQEHIDYWDPAEQIYRKISLLRPLMNFLVRKIKAM